MRKLVRSLLVLLLLASAAAVCLEPPPGEPPVRSFSMAEYKSNVQNWGAALGPDGLMYVGGGMGLLEYDGVRWTRHDTPNNSRVRVLHIEPRDNAPARFWIGSSNQFGYFERDATGAMGYYSISDRLPETEREFGDIRAIEQADGAFYFHALNMLFRWDGEALDRRSTWDGIFRLMVEVDGRVYVVVRNRLHEVTDFADPAPPPVDGWRLDGLGDASARLTFLEPWPDGRILLGTYAHGLHWISDDPPELFTAAVDLRGLWPFVVHRRDDGTFLVGTRHDGLLHFTEDGTLLEHITTRNGLPKPMINGLAEDGRGGVWLPQVGVISRVALDAPVRSWSPRAGIEEARGMTIHDERIILAVGGGIARLEAAGTAAARTVQLESPLIEGWDVQSIDGQLFVAGSEGVHRLVHDPETDALLESERVLADHYAYRLTRSRLRPAVYAEMETGLALLVRENGAWIDGGRVEGIDHRAHHVAEDAEGRVWAGTVLGRLYVLEWQGDQLVLVAELGADEGVPEGYAWPFMLGEGRNGRLVLGTFDGGYRPVLDAAGAVVGVEPDPDFGNDGLGTPRGIYKMASPDGVRVLAGIGEGGALRFGRIDAEGAFDWQTHPVPGIEVGQNSFILPDDEGAWVGRAPGLVRLDWPERATIDSVAALNITRAGYPDQQTWLLGGPSGKTMLADDALPFQKASLRFEYALTEYAQPDAHRYRVQLDGLDDDWSQWTDEALRDYTNLPGGDYIFRVQARDALGRVSESVPLAFSVAPPWYLGAPMLAVYAACALLLLMSAAATGRVRRERQLDARQRELEAQVAERTREVRRQAREIREISDARAAFFANVSHELRTPLTLTRAPLEEMAREARDLAPEQRRHLDMALRNTEVMQSLIGRVLDLHRLDVGRMPFQPRRADLAAAVGSTLRPFESLAGQRGVRLQLESADAPLPAVFDAGHLATIVSNLLSNALKFAPRDSAVRVRLAAGDGGYALEVIDAGPGVAPDARQRIFERYQQADDAPSGGTGIGLALVRELIELHGGRATVDDAPGAGARFQVWWPEQAEVAEPAASDPDPEPGRSGLHSAHVEEHRSDDTDPDAPDPRPTVLIVDDNEELRGFLRLRLGRAYRIVEAGDGREGLRQAQDCLPDAIVTDGMMPEIDGLAMTQQLKADPETDFIPVLMLTARGGPDAVIRGMQAGADDYLAKPFDSAELAARIAGLIASRRRLRERLAGQPVEPQAAEDPFIARARRIAAEHLGESEFTVRDWADLLHMDRTTLFRKLKSGIDRSPDEELREMRLQRAAELLRAKAGNVAEVADAVGFASVSAFSRRFRERFGESPAAFSRHRGEAGDEER